MKSKVWTTALPVIGDQRVDRQISSNGVLDVLQPIWLTKPETTNPVDAVRKALPRQTDRPKLHAALPFIELPAFLVTLEASSSHIIVKASLAFLIHTAARTGEALGASWPEIDDRRIWTARAERMKSAVEHRAPSPKLHLRCSSERNHAGKARISFSQGKAGASR